MGELNKIQEQIVGHHEGSLIVHAGPGSGKTRTVIHRTISMLGSGIKPESILLITFTREATKEIQNRVDSAYPDSGVWISTIHALGLAILKEELGPKMPRLLSEDESYNRFREMAYDSQVNPSREMYLDVTNLKALMIPLKGRQATIPYNLYVEYLDYHNEIDLQDLVLLSALILKNNKVRRAKWAKRWKYVIVDEAHDCTPAEGNLVDMLAGDNLCLVLDENQSIYAWREGNSRFMSKLRPKAVRYQLPYTYRCPENIYNKAWNLIRPYTEQQRLECTKGGGDFSIVPIELKGIPDLVNGKIGQMILCRTQDEVSDVSTELKKNKISVNKKRGLFDSYEAWVILKHAEASQGNQDAWKWVLSNPKREDTPELKRQALRASYRLPLEQFLLEWYDTCLSDDADGRERYNKIMNQCTKKTADFIKLLKKKKYPEDSVRVMTIHGSKGLESNHVILYNVNEGSIPHVKEYNIDAERRLLYVGMTRAKDRLTIIINPGRRPSRFLKEIENGNR